VQDQERAHVSARIGVSVLGAGASAENALLSRWHSAERVLNMSYLHTPDTWGRNTQHGISMCVPHAAPKTAPTQRRSTSCGSTRECAISDARATAMTLCVRRIGAMPPFPSEHFVMNEPDTPVHCRCIRCSSCHMGRAIRQTSERGVNRRGKEGWDGSNPR
jgi:hypothetical protein